MPDQTSDLLDVAAALAELRQHIPTLERLLRAARRWEQNLAASPPSNRPGNGPERTTGPCCGIPACGGGCGVNDPLPDTGDGDPTASTGLSEPTLDEIEADLDEVRRNVDHGEAQYNPHALTALRAAEKLLARVAELEAELERVRAVLAPVVLAIADDTPTDLAEQAAEWLRRLRARVAELEAHEAVAIAGPGWDRDGIDHAITKLSRTDGDLAAQVDALRASHDRKCHALGRIEDARSELIEVTADRDRLEARVRELEGDAATTVRLGEQAIAAEARAAKAVAFTAEAMLSVVRDWLRETGQRPPGPVRGALDLVEAALDQAAKAGGTTAAPTTWALPPGIEWDLVRWHCGRCGKRHTWTTEAALADAVASARQHRDDHEQWAAERLSSTPPEPPTAPDTPAATDAASQQVSGQKQADIPQASDGPGTEMEQAAEAEVEGRRCWVFRYACGCPFGLTVWRPTVDTPSRAWRDMYATRREQDRALDEGVTVELVDHDRYIREVYPQMGSDYQCPHGPVTADGPLSSTPPAGASGCAHHDQRCETPTALCVVDCPPAGMETARTVDRCLPCGGPLVERDGRLVHRATGGRTCPGPAEAGTEAQ